LPTPQTNDLATEIIYNKRVVTKVLMVIFSKIVIMILNKTLLILQKLILETIKFLYSTTLLQQHLTQLIKMLILMDISNIVKPLLQFLWETMDLQVKVRNIYMDKI
jgi:hypothetical protein